ncbi:MAG: hypothetical protein AB7T06_40075 [Kofleriaceae bacterium]
MPKQQINTPMRRTVVALYDAPEKPIEIGETVRVVGSDQTGRLTALPTEIGGTATEPLGSITYGDDGNIGETVPLRLIVRAGDPDPSPTGWGFGWAHDGDRLHHGEHWENTPTLFIGWDKGDSSVPGGVGTAVLTFMLDADEVLRAAADIQRNRRLIAEGAGLHPMEHVHFQTTGLSRAELQMLVRTARRARDDVYEGDE